MRALMQAQQQPQMQQQMQFSFFIPPNNEHNGDDKENNTMSSFSWTSGNLEEYRAKIRAQFKYVLMISCL